MILVFIRNKKKIEFNVDGGAEVKLYAVPADYSRDGVYISSWGVGELEPVPACHQNDAELLAHVSIIRQGNGSFSTQEIFFAKGVTYAQN